MRFLSFFSSQFRNLKSNQIEFSGDVNVILGANGQGKTNLLEALYLLSGFRSFRGARTRDLLTAECAQAQLKSHITVDGIEREVKLLLNPSKRDYWVDGKSSALLSDWIEKMVVVTFSPDDLFLVKGEPELRRRFVDRLIFLLEPAHLKNVITYQKTLKARNALLKDALYGRDQLLLDSFDEALATSGSAIFKSRNQWISQLNTLVNSEIIRLTAGVHQAQVAYDSEVTDDSPTALREAILRHRNDDLQRQTTTFGVHRDDIKLLLSGKSAQRFASQGEQRALTLALKLSETQLLEQTRHIPPVLLLDDVTAELDHTRTALLFEAVRANQGQTFIATTELSAPVKNLHRNMTIYQVKSGEISRDS